MALTVSDAAPKATAAPTTPQEASSSPGQATSSSSAVESPAEAMTLHESAHQNNDTGSDNSTKEEATTNEDKKAQDDKRHLDMLADTIRSIATGPEAASDASNVEQDANANAVPAQLVQNDTHEEAGVDTTDDVSSDSKADSTSAIDSTKRPALDEDVLPLKPSSKRQKRAEYSEETRALCVRRHEDDGVSYAEIAKELKIPHDTVRAIVRRAKRTGTVVSARRSGRPRKTSGMIDKVILEAVKLNKKCSAKAIQEELQRVFGVKVSSETVRRRVLDHNKQRLQAIAGGLSHEQDPSTLTEKDSDVDESTQDTVLGEAVETKTPLLDPVSFQQMLHEQAAIDALHTSTSSTIPAAVAEDVPFEATNTSSEAISNGVIVSEEVIESVVSINELPAPQQRGKRGEYSIEVREQCVALHSQGQGYRKIGKALRMPHTTVRAIVEKAQRTGSVAPAKRSGRPRKTDPVVDKVILQTVKNNQKSSARMIQEQLLETFGVQVSCETIRRRVKDHSLQSLSSSSSLDAVASEKAETCQEAPSEEVAAISPALTTIDDVIL